MQRDEVQVAMVGDGANDCGALKAADVGLSILKTNSEDSSGEASIAAPFSADNLPAIIELMKEGRAALVTSFQCFKFITMYSMIQFVCINFLYFLKSNMMDLQFLYEDLFMILPLAVFMAYTGASSRLTRTLPPGALISIPVISSVIGQVVIQGAFQIFSYFLLIKQDWYEDQETLNGTDPKSFTINAFSPYPAYENTVLFLISSVQLLIVCISFSIGPPYRQPAYRNLYFTISCIGITAISFYLTVFPTKNTRELLQMMDMPISFKWTLFGIILFGCLVTWLYERFGVGLITRLIKKYIR
jgi:cation-transporting ATPase 13A3/4/5